MQRRHAILDDNQRLLEKRLDDLRREIPPLVDERVKAAIVIGSVAEGRARDESDLDLVLVLREGEPRRADYRWWDEYVGPLLPDGGRFPVQPIFIAEHSLKTDEPNLRAALRRGLPLWDPDGILA